MRIRMLETQYAAPDIVKVYRYIEGEVYGTDTTPYVTDALMRMWIDEGLAVEVDASGNPIGTPAAKRATKKLPKDTQGLRADEADDDEG